MKQKVERYGSQSQYARHRKCSIAAVSMRMDDLADAVIQTVGKRKVLDFDKADELWGTIFDTYKRKSPFATEPPPELAIRKCLKCQNNFESSSKFNRLCDPCKKANSKECGDTYGVVA